MGLRQRRQQRQAQKRKEEASTATSAAVGELADAVSRLTSSTRRFVGLSTSQALGGLEDSPTMQKARTSVGTASARAGSAAKTARRKTNRWLTLASLLGFAVVAKKVREQPVPPDADDPGPDRYQVEGRA